MQRKLQGRPIGRSRRRRKKEPRGHCWMCGAVKYQKFLHRVEGQRYGGRWECNDIAQCANRSANYGDKSGEGGSQRTTGHD